MKVIRPFGPTIAKVKIPKEIIKDLNNYVDKIIENEKKTKVYNEVLKNFPDANLINVHDDKKDK